jgi:hypothetical protein
VFANSGLFDRHAASAVLKQNFYVPLRPVTCYIDVPPVDRNRTLIKRKVAPATLMPPLDAETAALLAWTHSALCNHNQQHLLGFGSVADSRSVRIINSALSGMLDR